MNLKKLRAAEALFLHKYPGGFADEQLQDIGKKHNVNKLVDYASTALAKSRFKNQAAVCEDIIKIVSRSSMVSMFEKPKFRDYVNGLSRDDRTVLSVGFRRLLHGNQQQGFNDIVEVLSDGRLAKWSLLTICLLYHDPQQEVFVKPTTTKNVIRQFELENLVYQPRPTWEFYSDYRNVIAAMKAEVHPSLSPNNAAFTGFLMMSTAVHE